MEAKELRIGNFIFWDGDFYEIKASFFDQLEDTIIEPILLTEEWLLKFGFERSRDSSFYSLVFPNKHKVFISISFEMDCQQLCQAGYGFSVDLKHVHQLQNLYFALTSEELKYQK